MLEVTEQRPVNNEYVNSWISLGWHFKILQQIFINVVTRNHEVNSQIFYSARFSLEWQKQLCIWGFGAERQRAIISWDHYLTT